VNRCPKCNEKISFLSFYEWLKKFNENYVCKQCGNKIIGSEWVLAIYVALIPTYFVANLLVEMFSDLFDLGFIVKTVVFSLILIVLIVCEIFVIFKLWPLRKKGSV